MNKQEQVSSGNARTEKSVFHDSYGNKYTANELVMIATGKRKPLGCFIGKTAGEWEK